MNKKIKFFQTLCFALIALSDVSTASASDMNNDNGKHSYANACSFKNCALILATGVVLCQMGEVDGYGNQKNRTTLFSPRKRFYEPSSLKVTPHDIETVTNLLQQNHPIAPSDFNALAYVFDCAAKSNFDTGMSAMGLNFENLNNAIKNQHPGIIDSFSKFADALAYNFGTVDTVKKTLQNQIDYLKFIKDYASQYADSANKESVLKVYKSMVSEKDDLSNQISGIGLRYNFDMFKSVMQSLWNSECQFLKEHNLKENAVRTGENFIQVGGVLTAGGVFCGVGFVFARIISFLPSQWGWGPFPVNNK